MPIDIPQGIPRAPGMVLPSMQLQGTQNVLDAQYPPTLPYPFALENWKDNGFIHSTVTSPEKIGFVLPGNYEINLEVSGSASLTTKDLYFEYSLDGGVGWGFYLRTTPMVISGVSWVMSYQEFRAFSPKDVLALRVYADTTGGATDINVLLTITLMNPGR